MLGYLESLWFRGLLRDGLILGPVTVSVWFYVFDCISCFWVRDGMLGIS